MKNLNKHIDSLPSDDSSNLEYTTQSRYIKGNLYWLDNDINYQKSTHRRIYAEWGILKEDSTGTESNANAIQRKEHSLFAIDSQIDNLEEMQKVLLVKHVEILGREYVKPIKGSRMVVSNQEIDSNYVPKQR